MFRTAYQCSGSPFPCFPHRVRPKRRGVVMCQNRSGWHGRAEEVLFFQKDWGRQLHFHACCRIQHLPKTPHSNSPLAPLGLGPSVQRAVTHANAPYKPAKNLAAWEVRSLGLGQIPEDEVAGRHQKRTIVLVLPSGLHPFFPVL